MTFDRDVGWCLAGDGIRQYWGKWACFSPDLGLLTLDPAYEYVLQKQIDPRSGIQIMRALVPLEMLASCKVVSLVVSTLIHELDAIDRREMDGLVARAEEMRTALRGSRSGIMVPKVSISAQGKMVPP